MNTIDSRFFSANILKDISLRYSKESDTYYLKRPFYRTYVRERIIKMLKIILTSNPDDYMKVHNIACGPAIFEQHFPSLLEKR
jgi:hypothetical protein